MPGKEVDALKRIQQILSKDQREQKQKGTQIRGIKAQLERIASDTVAKYRREVEATRPDAELVINQDIQTWFSELIATGTYAKLLSWSKSHSEDVRLSDSILYYWPKRALAGDKLSSETAKFIAEEYKEKGIQTGIQVHADSDEVWYAGFKLDQWSKSEGITIWREPVVGMGFGFAMIAKEYEIPIDANNTIVSLDRISPEVWIKFGEQIKSGKVWETIGQSMKIRRTDVVTAAGTQRWREEAKGIAQGYLRTRQWH